MDFMGTTPELHCLINGAHSALDIKTMLDAQFTRKANLEHVMNYSPDPEARGASGDLQIGGGRPVSGDQGKA